MAFLHLRTGGSSGPGTSWSRAAPSPPAHRSPGSGSPPWRRPSSCPGRSAPAPSSPVAPSGPPPAVRPGRPVRARPSAPAGRAGPPVRARPRRRRDGRGRRCGGLAGRLLRRPALRRAGAAARPARPVPAGTVAAGGGGHGCPPPSPNRPNILSPHRARAARLASATFAEPSEHFSPSTGAGAHGYPPPSPNRPNTLTLHRSRRARRTRHLRRTVRTLLALDRTLLHGWSATFTEPSAHFSPHGRLPQARLVRDLS